MRLAEIPKLIKEGGNVVVALRPAVPLGIEEQTPQPQSPESATANLESEAQKRPSSLIRLWRFGLVSAYASGKVTWVTLRTIARYLINHPVHAALNGVLIAVLGVLVMTGSQIHNQIILNQISDQTIDRIIEASAYTREFDGAQANRDGMREFLRVGAPSWIQRESIRAILYHSRQVNLSIVDQAVLLATAEIESGFNPMARAATTSACGLFQFVQRTGEAFELPTEDCMNPWLNARSGIEHYISNYQARVKKQVDHLEGAERVLRTFELTYYLHHDGPNSNSPSNDLKAIVLGGSHFLFKVYHVLQEEAESPKLAPSFWERFSENFVRMLNAVAAYFGEPELTHWRW